MTEIPDIYIDVSDIFSDEFIETFETDLKADGLNLTINVRKQQTQFALAEWAVPSFLAAYILKSYFDGFLKEAGKDHYSVLKNWLTSKMKILKTMTTTTVVSENSPDKIDINNTQSKAFSIESITLDGVKIKFLFDNNLNIEQWILLSDKSLELLNDHFTNYPIDKISLQIKEIHIRGNQIFGLIDNNNLEWTFKGY